ncbi:MAG TPA: hypothetical protein DCM05_13595 [Elusimicrobia bacterium]|nr:hypothetical protein [Elusimicrobiota bacterium]
MQPGDFVSHPTFGVGRVVDIRINKVDAMFAKDGRRTLLRNSLAPLRSEKVAFDKLWRLRENGANLSASVEQVRLTSPKVASAYESFLEDLVSFVPENRWEVPSDSGTLYFQMTTLKSSAKGFKTVTKRIAFAGVEGEPARIVVAVIDIKRLPEELRALFTLVRKGYKKKDYLRAELPEDQLSRLPKLLAALRAVVVRGSPARLT